MLCSLNAFMTLQSILVRIKRQEGPLEVILYRFAKAVRTFEMPAPRGFFRTLYYILIGLRSLLWPWADGVTH